jgi:hypothetical protein
MRGLMNVESASPLLTWFLVAAFVVFAVASGFAVWSFRRGSVQSGRGVLAVVWIVGSVVVALIGYRQYGLSSLPPAAFAVGVSVLIVYFASRLPAVHASWLAIALLVSAGTVLATAVLPLSLLLFLVLFGIDGP